jgi:copper chaperone CopZ
MPNVATSHTRATAESIFSLLSVRPPLSSTPIERRLRQLNGVRKVVIDSATQTIQVKYDPSNLTPDQLKQCLSFDYVAIDGKPEIFEH